MFPINTPHSKEAFFMRKLFHEHFPSDNAAKTVMKWIPKWQENEDPSGRASKVHKMSIHKDEERKISCGSSSNWSEESLPDGYTTAVIINEHDDSEAEPPLLVKNKKESRQPA
ncbi:unnamed protein product [Gongylonema pulchrum]|uniref:DUF4817 domain-containing protein n=1 Tax=Gongylonema pulchrum TaxID=637853 RepID=A0A183DAB7_9BILA|nr:unnamed protein product [Gongylonema pulchrum]